MKSSGASATWRAPSRMPAHRVKAIQAEKEAEAASRQNLQSELNLIGVTGDALKRRMRDEFDVDLEAIDLAAFEPVENCEEELARP